MLPVPTTEFNFDEGLQKFDKQKLKEVPTSACLAILVASTKHQFRLCQLSLSCCQSCPRLTASSFCAHAWKALVTTFGLLMSSNCLLRVSLVPHMRKNRSGPM